MRDWIYKGEVHKAPPLFHLLAMGRTESSDNIAVSSSGIHFKEQKVLTLKKTVIY